ncbi:hypothetical protein NFI96_032526 [Prochilodus magdalenae]|nr:hypothetical protein NFI96_032526 [Prochilodus magdalenae]
MQYFILLGLQACIPVTLLQGFQSSFSLCGFSQNQLSVVEYLLELERREVKLSFWSKVWSVTYNPTGDMCFKKGSTVFYEWIFDTLPEGLIVTEAFWTIENQFRVKGPN